MKVDAVKTFLTHTDRVKCVEFHPTEPWLLTALYTGDVHLWHYEDKKLLKTFHCGDAPVRAAKFVVRKHWIVTGGDDFMVRVFNYNTQQKVHDFEAHTDFIRYIIIHPVLPLIITSSDDTFIKIWNWDQRFRLDKTLKGHNHYVMSMDLNPKDQSIFASASLDRSVKLWSVDHEEANLTLVGHKQGANAVAFYPGSDKPYLASGADDWEVIVWDYQTRTIVSRLSHRVSVTCLVFLPGTPLLFAGDESDNLVAWNTSTFKKETSIGYGLGRVWTLAVKPGQRAIATGCDEGTFVVSIGNQRPVVSMDDSGKLVLAENNAICRSVITEVAANDGHALKLSFTEMGTCEFYPTSLSHSPNGRFVAACGDGEWTVYTAHALRNKAFGRGGAFAWCQSGTANAFAILSTTTTVTVFKNFTEAGTISTSGVINGIFSGQMLGVKTGNSILFYDWQTLEIVDEIIQQDLLNVYWSPDGQQVAITSKTHLFILSCDESYSVNRATKTEGEEVPSAFSVTFEVEESVSSAVWAESSLVYTTAKGSGLAYIAAGERHTLAHPEGVFFLFKYLARDSRLFLIQGDRTVVSYTLPISLIAYQQAVVDGDFQKADVLLPEVPTAFRSRLAHFLEKRGFIKQAIVLADDVGHRFVLAIRMKMLDLAVQLAEEIDTVDTWRQTALLATQLCKFDVAVACYNKAQDYGSMLLIATSTGSTSLLETLASTNSTPGFYANLLLQNYDACIEYLIDCDRLPEATFFAHSYRSVPEMSRLVGLWRQNAQQLADNNVKKNVSEKIADPGVYPNLFTGLEECTGAVVDKLVPLDVVGEAEECQPVDNGKEEDENEEKRTPNEEDGEKNDLQDEKQVAEEEDEGEKSPDVLPLPDFSEDERDEDDDAEGYATVEDELSEASTTTETDLTADSEDDESEPNASNA